MDSLSGCLNKASFTVWTIASGVAVLAKQKSLPAEGTTLFMVL